MKKMPTVRPLRVLCLAKKHKYYKVRATNNHNNDIIFEWIRKYTSGKALVNNKTLNEQAKVLCLFKDPDIEITAHRLSVLCTSSVPEGQYKIERHRLDGYDCYTDKDDAEAHNIKTIPKEGYALGWIMTVTSEPRSALVEPDYDTYCPKNKKPPEKKPKVGEFRVYVTDHKGECVVDYNIRANKRKQTMDISNVMVPKFSQLYGKLR